MLAQDINETDDYLADVAAAFSARAFLELFVMQSRGGGSCVPKQP